MLVRRVVLRDESETGIPFSDLVSVAAALQIQLDRDFTPIWGVRAQITAQLRQDPVPAGAWPIRIVKKPVGGLGIHLDKHGKPFAQVKSTSDWSVTASHELLEMLVDPLGHKFVRAADMDPNSDGHLVSYLIEVGDPCEVFSYSINSVAVSDFVLPEFYDTNATGAPVDFMARLSGPYDVPDGCYISWIDPADQRWHQKTTDGLFVRAERQIDPHKNPRDDRDVKLPEGDVDRHDLSRIRQAYDANRK